MERQVASEWVLIISGLIAHADGILEHEECERLLSMLDEEEVDAETSSSWVTNIGDLEFLEERFLALPPPEGDAVFVALREAWLMASATSALPLSMAKEPTAPALMPRRIVPNNTTLVL